MKHSVQKRIYLLSVIVLMCALFYTCSKSEEVLEEPEPEIEEPLIIDSNKIVTINTSAVVGPMYNFSSTRPMVNQTRFNNASFRESIEHIKPYVKSYNLVTTKLKHGVLELLPSQIIYQIIGMALKKSILYTMILQ